MLNVLALDGASKRCSPIDYRRHSSLALKYENEKEYNNLGIGRATKPGPTRSPGLRRGKVPRRRKAASKRRVPLTIYVPADLLKRLMELAIRDRRSASTQGLILIERGLDQKPE